MKENLLGTDVICQIGLVVRDVEAASRAWAEVLGVDPPEARLTDAADVTHARYRGEPTEARAKLAFFRTGQFSLELIEPVGGPSTWREFLDEHGEGVHHVAFRVTPRPGGKGMDEVLARLGEKGMPAVQRGDYTGGRYGYVDSADRLKVIVELLENTNTATLDSHHGEHREHGDNDF